MVRSPRNLPSVQLKMPPPSIMEAAEVSVGSSDRHGAWVPLIATLTYCGTVVTGGSYVVVSAPTQVTPDSPCAAAGGPPEPRTAEAVNADKQLAMMRCTVASSKPMDPDLLAVGGIADRLDG
jgi:hypothetical protein